MDGWVTMARAAVVGLALVGTAEAAAGWQEAAPDGPSRAAGPAWPETMPRVTAPAWTRTDTTLRSGAPAWTPPETMPRVAAPAWTRADTTLRSGAPAWTPPRPVHAAGAGLLLALAAREAASDLDPAGLGRLWHEATAFASARDKQLHFFASASLTLSVAVATGEPGWAVALALVTGIAKEVIWDHLLGRGTPAAGDVGANALGVAFACLMIHLGERLGDP